MLATYRSSVPANMHLKGERYFFASSYRYRVQCDLGLTFQAKALCQKEAYTWSLFTFTFTDKEP